jgi:hypothetical protein
MMIGGDLVAHKENVQRSDSSRMTKKVCCWACEIATVFCISAF